ncbi:hypothetical protein GQ42DRAFT_105431, partial [Ramicandelaber brevisporus]
SYCRLPERLASEKCSGKDSLCREVLNDHYGSVQKSLGEEAEMDDRVLSQFEDTLMRIEEERADLDLHIDSNMSVIATLQDVSDQINKMSQSEKEQFTLPEGLTTGSTAIYNRTIKKLYGNERGNDVIEALQRNPAVAIPV